MEIGAGASLKLAVMAVWFSTFAARQARMEVSSLLRGEGRQPGIAFFTLSSKP